MIDGIRGIVLLFLKKGGGIKMRHHILVKWKEGYSANVDQIRALFEKTLEIPGISSVSVHPNIIERKNRYDLLILLCMRQDALEEYDNCQAHHDWKEQYGEYIDKKAIFDCE
jgi:hypothetical protein